MFFNKFLPSTKAKYDYFLWYISCLLVVGLGIAFGLKFTAASGFVMILALIVSTAWAYVDGHPYWLTVITGGLSAVAVIVFIVSLCVATVVGLINMVFGLQWLVADHPVQVMDMILAFVWFILNLRVATDFDDKYVLNTNHE